MPQAAMYTNSEDAHLLPLRSTDNTPEKWTFLHLSYNDLSCFALPSIRDLQDHVVDQCSSILPLDVNVTQFSPDIVKLQKMYSITMLLTTKLSALFD